MSSLDEHNDPSIPAPVAYSFVSLDPANLQQQKDITAVKDESIAYEEVLERIGLGKAHLLVLLAAGLFIMLVINESMGMGIVAIASQCDFQSSSLHKSILTAGCFLGIISSSYFWGYLSDVIGRRKILAYSTLMGNLVSFLSMFVSNFWLFVFLRLVIGILISGASSTSYAYLAEFYIDKYRPVVINYVSMFVGISMAYVPAVAWLVLSMDWAYPMYGDFEFRPWRLLIFFNLLPGLIASCMLLLMPESPKFLLSVMRQEEAYAATNWVCRLNTGQQLSDFGICKLEKEERSASLKAPTKSMGELFLKMWQETKPLFTRPHNVNFMISCTVMFGIFLGSSGMGLWFPDIQNRLGDNGPDASMTVCAVIDQSIEKRKENQTEGFCDDSINSKSFQDSIIVGSIYVIGYVLLGLVIRPLGRKNIMVGALLVSSLCGFMLIWMQDATIIVVSFCLFLVLPGVCVSILSGTVVDLVPTYLRGKAVCLCLMMGRFGAVVGSNIIGVLLESQCLVTFSAFSCFVLICAALTLILPM